jgi:hypothetical protein
MGSLVPTLRSGDDGGVHVLLLARVLGPCAVAQSFQQQALCHMGHTTGAGNLHLLWLRVLLLQAALVQCMP